MSQMIGDQNAVVTANDIRMHMPSRNQKPLTSKISPRVYSYATRYWPGSAGCGFYGDTAADIGVGQAQSYGPMERIAEGAASRVGFVGITRDQYGAPLGGVTCSLFRTSDRQWIMDVVSRSDGGFGLVSPYSPDTHFIVYLKSGAPDVFGTTKQTLVGA